MRKFLVLLLVAMFAFAVPFVQTASAGSNKPCPEPAPADGPPPNCGNGKGGGGEEPPPPPPPPPGDTCGPETSGGVAPTTTVGGLVWAIGHEFTIRDGAAVGDLLQTVGCALPL